MTTTSTAASIDERFRPLARAGVASVVVDGQAVVHGPGPDRLAVLNPTATLVWQCCDGSGTVAEIAADAAAVFAAPPRAVLRDVLDVVRRFAAQGLLEGVAADGDPASMIVGPSAAGPAGAVPRALVDPPSP
jgi:hypothetical protein